MQSTIEDVPKTNMRRAPWARRIGTVLLALFIGSGAAGLLGDSVQMESADEAGYTLTLKYPKVTRSELDVPWELDITSTEPMHEQIVVAVTSDYFDIFDHQGHDTMASYQTE